MQMQTGRHWQRSVLAAVAVLVLSACNVGDEHEEPLQLGTSEAELSCQVSQQCADGTSITCGSASGICASGADNGGWVECNGSRTYCPTTTPCTCESTRRTSVGYATSFNCPGAWALARTDARDLANQQCPRGTCNVVTTNGTCTRVDATTMGAEVTATYSCMGPPNCQ
ncbi:MULTISPECIES: lipoprotein [Myxococcus]|uniref:lipoprotein n=1 Tax=Myxococcus TaxID=32 RepID=UPI0011430F64|nr:MULTISPECIES: lipoprotein [Myxococcus]NOK06315.1 lipoprotein [Myxococcus xanthus]